MKLYAALCIIFSARQDGSASITDLMRNRSLRGQVDEPRKIAILTELLNRVAELEKKLEDQKESVVSSGYMDAGVNHIVNYETTSAGTQSISLESKEVNDLVEETLNDPEMLSWIEVRAKAKELGVFKPGLKRSELEALIASKSTP